MTSRASPRTPSSGRTSRSCAATRGSAARAGTIRGRVEVRRAVAPAERRPNVADLGTPSALHDLTDRLRSVVYLDSAPRRAFDEVEPGRAVRAFDTRWGRAAVIICEDAWHSLVPTIAALDAAFKKLHAYRAGGAEDYVAADVARAARLARVDRSL